MFSITFHDLTDGEPEDDLSARAAQTLRLLFNTQLDAALVRALADEALLYDTDANTPHEVQPPKLH